MNRFINTLALHYSKIFFYSGISKIAFYSEIAVTDSIIPKIVGGTGRDIYSECGDTGASSGAEPCCPS
jgi:hypothetical protein